VGVRPGGRVIRTTGRFIADAEDRGKAGLCRVRGTDRRLPGG
jgi:hypothetical protein